MSYIHFIFQDWKANKGNFKGRVFTILFRIANYAILSKVYKVVFYPYLLFYKILTEFFLGFEIPYNTKIGSSFQICHGYGLVINRGTVIGKNVVLRHTTTIGNNGKTNKCPIIFDNVNIGTHVCIIGDLEIGENVVIGAGSIITKTILSNQIVYGNPPIFKVNNYSHISN